MPATAGGVVGGKVAIDNERQISMRIRPHFLGSRARSTTKSPATQLNFTLFDIIISYPETSGPFSMR